MLTAHTASQSTLPENISFEAEFSRGNGRFSH